MKQQTKTPTGGFTNTQDALSCCISQRDELQAHAERLANGLRPFIEKQSGLTTAQEIINAFNALKEWDALNLKTRLASDTATN
jgi:hypothetical protein